jgi:hypothetical protein
MKLLYSFVSACALIVSTYAQLDDILDKASQFHDVLTPEKTTLFHDDYTLFNMNISQTRLHEQNITVHNTWSRLPDAFTSNAELGAHFACHKENRPGQIFFQYHDIAVQNSPMRFFVETPMKLSYVQKLERELKKAGFVITKDVLKTCRFMAVETVSARAIHRGRIYYRPRWILETEKTVRRYEPASLDRIEDIKKIMQTTYPTTEIVLILTFSLLPIWLAVGWGLWILMRMREIRLGDESDKENAREENEKTAELGDINEMGSDAGEEVTVHVADLGVRVDKARHPRRYH